MKNQVALAIIGAQKAGSTSLKTYLSEHPNIISHYNIEFDYFVNDDLYEVGFQKVLEQQFPKTRNLEEVLVIKNVALYRSKKGLERLRNDNPDCKIVFLVREPVERAYSSFKMEHFYGAKYSFDQIKLALSSGDLNHPFYHLYIKPGLYAEQLKVIYDIFPKDQVRIWKYEDFSSNASDVCKEIFDWLRVPSNFTPQTTKIHNKGKEQRSKYLGKLIASLRKEGNPLKVIAKRLLPYSLFFRISKNILSINEKTLESNEATTELHDFLHAYYKPFNEELESLTGLDLSDWINKQ